MIRSFPALALAVAALSVAPAAHAQSAEEEKFYTVKDGMVDQATYNGYRRYHAACHVCHGPDGLGSSYAPAMTESLKVMNYDDFTEIVVNGRENVTGTQQNVMPAFGEVPDVMNYIDDIFAYLQARTDGVVDRGRPQRFDR